MPYVAALSTQADSTQAVEEAIAQVVGPLAGTPDLAILFFSPHHIPAAEQIAATAHKRLGARCLLGCCGEAIVGNDQEIERRPALSLWLARWPRPVHLTPFHIQLEQTPEGPSLLGWPDSLGNADATRSAVLLVGNPFSFPADAFLREVNQGYPGLRTLGGMASGGRGPGESPLILNGQVMTTGAAGVLVQGPITIRSIVSQGCRPIGRHMIVTSARDNIIAELSGHSPLVQLQEIWDELSTHEQQLFQQGLHIGRVINEYQGEFHRGDFLVRNVIGLEKETGSLAITDHIRVGQTVQFHIRDAESADEDLHALLQMDLHAHAKPPQGALLFTCNGRGTRLFQKPHHDAQVIRSEAGPVPLAGFFAQGELGPVGGQNFIHGFTASVVLFED